MGGFWRYNLPDIQGASAIRNLLIRNVGARSAISWLGNRDPQLPRGHFRPLGTSPEKCERFLKFSVFQFSTFSPEVRTIFDKFELSTFRSEEIGHPQRVSRVRNSGSRANSEVSYQTGDLYLTACPTHTPFWVAAFGRRPWGC